LHSKKTSKAVDFELYMLHFRSIMEGNYTFIWTLSLLLLIYWMVI